MNNKVTCPTNDQMKAGRFLLWHKLRQTVKEVQSICKSGGHVIFRQDRAQIKITKKNCELVKAGKTGFYFQNGSKWVFMSFTCDIFTYQN